MPFEIVTTHFVAHEHDLDSAYDLYRQRIAGSGAEIAATLMVVKKDGQAEPWK